MVVVGGWLGECGNLLGGELICGSVLILLSLLLVVVGYESRRVCSRSNIRNDAMTMSNESLACRSDWDRVANMTKICCTIP